MPRKKPEVEPLPQRNVTPARPRETIVDGADFTPELQELLKAYPTTYTVAIRKLKADSSAWLFCRSVPADIATEELIQSRWGGGRYKLQFHNEKGHIVTTIERLEIAEALGDEPAPETPGVIPGAPAPPVTALATTSPMEQLFLAMREQQIAQNLLLQEAIRALGTRNEGSSGGTLGEAVAALTGLQKMVPQPATNFSESLVMKSFDILSKQGSASPGDGSLGSEIRLFFTDVVKEILPQFGFGKTPAAAAAPAQLNPGTPETEEKDEEDTNDAMPFQIMDGLNYIHEKYLAKKKPDVMAELVLLWVGADPNAMDAVKKLLGEPIEKLIEQDPRLKDLKYRNWFDSLFEVLRVQLLGSAANSERASGH